jgi:hypothetical protein
MVRHVSWEPLLLVDLADADLVGNDGLRSAVVVVVADEGMAELVLARGMALWGGALAPVPRRGVVAMAEGESKTRPERAADRKGDGAASKRGSRCPGRARLTWTWASFHSDGELSLSEGCTGGGEDVLAGLEERPDVSTERAGLCSE